jgi:superfamily II DNA/RNA helicase
MGQRHVDLGSVEITVLDEADHMADLGFLPGVRRIMDTTPRRGQRMLFSATLDAGVDVLVKRFLANPATHQADSAQSPVSTMTHHVLHVSHDGRLPVLLDLTAAPGRSVVFTRTKHGAKKLAKQLNASGVSAVELHGNLSQSARTRNMNMFHSGAASTLVATDIAARGIHVDDVGIVIHADPPVEHKAYLHRSGRTARAGADGVVVTLMTDDQVRDVRDLTRLAGVSATTTRVHATHPLLAELAPGPRVPTSPIANRVAESSPRPPAGRSRQQRPAARPAARRSAPGQSDSARSGRRDGAAPAGGESGRPRRNNRPRRAGSTTTHTSSSSGYRSGGAAAFSAGSRVGSRQR